VTPATSDQVDSKLAEILAADEFATATEAAGAETQAIGELFDAILGTLEGMIGGLRANHPEVFVLILVGGLAVVGAAIWFGARALARRRHTSGGGGDDAPKRAADEVSRLQQEAKALATSGDHLGAARALFRAMLIEQAIDEGLLDEFDDGSRYARAKTYGELVGTFARSDDERRRLEAVATELEAGVYGDGRFDVGQWKAVVDLARGARR